MIGKSLERITVPEMPFYGDAGFEEIPIYLPKIYDGFGDLMTTLKLAKGLQAEFKEPVRIYITDTEPIERLVLLDPKLEIDDGVCRHKGIEMRLVDEDALRVIFAKSMIGIFAPVASTVRYKQDMFINAMHNIYVEEYDGYIYMHLPEGIRSNQTFIDQRGREHRVARTGFQEGSFGIHIDTELGMGCERLEPDAKIAMLERAGLGWLGRKIPGLLDSYWACAYYPEDYIFRTRSSGISYLKAAMDACDASGQRDMPIAIFDFSRFDPEEYSSPFEIKALKREPFVDHFVVDGKLHTIRGKGDGADRRYRNIQIIHAGNQSHGTFLEFLRNSELPAAITGDASLAEAVSMDKIFLYCPPGWKSALIHNFVNLAPDILSWQDADRIMSVFGCERVDPKSLETYPKLEEFYLSRWKKIDEAHIEERLCREKGNYTTAAEEIFRAMGGSIEDYRYFKANSFEICMAWQAKERGRRQELHELWKSHVFGTGFGSEGLEKTHLLFYDQIYQESFHRMNRALAEKMNLPKNLAKIIKESLQGV